MKRDTVVVFGADPTRLTATYELFRANPNNLGKNLRIRSRQFKILFNKKLFDYPFKLNISLIKKLGLRTTFVCGLSYLVAQIFPHEEETLEDVYVNRLGYKFYSLFFENYIKTVWGKHPSQIPATQENANKPPRRGCVTVSLLVKKPKSNINSKPKSPKIAELKDACLYIYDPNVKLARIQIYNNWSQKLVKDPKHTALVGLEYFCQKSGKFWQKTDQQLAQKGIKELKKIGLINSKRDVLGFHVERTKKPAPSIEVANKSLQQDISQNATQDIPKNTSQKSRKTFVQRFKNLTPGQKLLSTAFLLWLIITFVTTLFFHENWEDEGQAWLLARDCTLPQLVAQMQVEGHFLPWYLILMPFAKLGLPFKTVNLINWLITTIGVRLILKHYPGKSYKKVLLLFSSAFFFWYPVIARCYCLLPLSVGLLLKFYKTRFKKPLPYLLSLVLLVNVHIHTLAFSAIIGLDYLKDWLKLRPTLSKSKNNKILLAGLLSMALIILSGLHMLDAVSVANSTTSFNTGSSLENVTLTSAFTGPLIFYARFLANGLPPLLIYIPLALFVINLLKTRPAVFWKIAIVTTSSFAAYAFLFANHLPQRIFILIFAYLVFSIRHQKKMPSKIITVCLEVFVLALLLVTTIQTGNIFCSVFTFSYLIQTFAPPYLRYFHGINFQRTLNSLSRFSLLFLGFLAVLAGLQVVYQEVNYDYSDSQKSAEYIQNNLPSSYIVVNTENIIEKTSIIAYLPKERYLFYSQVFDKFVTYAPEFASNSYGNNTMMLAEENLNALNPVEICEEIYKKNEHKPCYYLTEYDPDFYDAIDKFLEEKGQLSYTKKLERDGILTLLYDSYDPTDTWEQAPYEHYRLYQINTDHLH